MMNHTSNAKHTNPAETNTPDTTGGCRVTRGHPPVVAIAEGMHYAERIGFQVIVVYASWRPCDFMAISEGKITLGRVRRLRSRALWPARYHTVM